MVRRPNRTATRRSIAALSAGGRLEDADAALVGLARSTADLLDEGIDAGEKGYAVAQLARVHLSTVLALLGGRDTDVDAGLSEVIAALSSPLVDAPQP
jgi:hypothetical protein